MINVKINNKDEQLAEDTKVSALLKSRRVKKAAVWINGRQLLSAEYETYTVKDADEIRILRLIAGG